MKWKKQPAGMRDAKRRAELGAVNWRHAAIFAGLGAVAALAIHLLIPASGHSSSNTSHIMGKASPAPQGNFEYTTIKLERPDESLPTNVVAVTAVVWSFEGLPQEQVTAVLETIQLPTADKAALLDHARWNITPKGTEITPPTAVILALLPEDRKRLYELLAKSDNNVFFQYPFRVKTSELDAWLTETGMSAPTAEIFKKLSYPDGDSTLFADYLLMEELCPPADKPSVAKALSQVPALLMNLRVDSKTDVNAVVKYWEKGGRGRMMKPFLESLTKLPEGRSISVSFFLPTFARIRLYTYPNTPVGQRGPDCFWSAMNFFGSEPDNRFYDPAFIQSTLKNQYTRISGNWVFGDIIMLVEDGNKALHMCVYLADGVVFTKNGGHDLQPWILMKMDDMLATYTKGRKVDLLGYRRKG